MKSNHVQRGSTETSSGCLPYPNISFPPMAPLWEGRNITPVHRQGLNREPGLDLPDLPDRASDPGLGAVWPQASLALQGRQRQGAEMSLVPLQFPSPPVS